MMAPNENPGAGGTAHGVADDVRRSNAPELAPDAGYVNSSDTAVYVASNIKRDRRTRKEIRAIKAAIINILSNDSPQTVRQVFYALTVRGAIRKE